MRREISSGPVGDVVVVTPRTILTSNGPEWVGTSTLSGIPPRVPPTPRLLDETSGTERGQEGEEDG